MKRIALLVLGGLISLQVFSQSAEKNVLKFNPLSLILSTGTVFYERKIDDFQSLQLGLSYTGIKIDDLKYQGIIITPEYRRYLKGNALSGTYFAPYLRYQRFNLTNTDSKSEATFSSIGGGLLIGRQWIYDSGISLDIFAGPSYSSGSFEYKDGGSSSDFDTNWGVEGFGIRVGLAVGFGL